MSGKDQLVHQLARSGDVQALKALLDRDPQLALARGSFGRLPIHDAAGSGAIESLQLLIDYMTKLRSQGLSESLYPSSQTAIVDVPDTLHAWTPLFGVVQANLLNCAELLLEYSASPNIRSAKSTRHETPLFYAKSVEMVLLLERYGADLNIISSQDQYAFEAIGWRSLEMLQFWLSRGVNVNHAPGFHNSILDSLIISIGESYSSSSIEWVNLLLDYGADPNMRDRSGGTSLHTAVLGKKADVARLLLDRKTNPNTQSLNGDTPLHYAAKFGATELAQLLLDHGANPNAQNLRGDTPLHCAAKYGVIELAHLLIQYGADVNIRNRYRRLAWDYAQKSPELLATLEAHWLGLPNPRPTPQQLIERILTIPKFRDVEFIPCSEADIRHLEQKFNVILPEAYKQFLRMMGKGTGRFLATTDWSVFYDYLVLGAQDEEFAELFEHLQLPEHYFVFASDHTEANLFFVADGKNDDPPIYYFGSRPFIPAWRHDNQPIPRNYSFWSGNPEKTIEKQYDSFWDWFEERVIHCEYHNQKGVV